MGFYLLREDVGCSDRWWLGDIRDCDNWNFSNPPVEYMEPCTYTLDVRDDGLELDYSTAGYASVPIVSNLFKDALVGIPEIDDPYCNTVFEPVIVANKNVRERYFSMIIETQLDCVDEEHSDFKKYVVNDPVRPDLVGNYSAFFNLVVDPKLIDGQHIFRIKKHLGAIVVSQEVKNRLERFGVTGVIFDSVNGDRETVA